jgi:hypothetical protein
MVAHMSRSIVARFVNPRKFRRERERQHVEALRRRDGDHCRRCRRPIRFDLPSGHDRGPAIEPLLGAANGGVLDNFCLTHGRCNADGIDHTNDVQERIRRRSEAELLPRARKRA